MYVYGAYAPLLKPSAKATLERGQAVDIAAVRKACQNIAKQEAFGVVVDSAKGLLAWFKESAIDGIHFSFDVQEILLHRRGKLSNLRCHEDRVGKLARAAEECLHSSAYR